MIHPRWRWKASLARLGAALVLALAAALLALGLSVFLSSFSSHDVKDYEPKDIPRGVHLEQTE